MLERFFGLRAAGTTVTTECLAGVTTFMTMAYIIFVNPQILAAGGVPRDAAMVATCIGAGLATLLMGLLANYPLALAPGMGLNAFLAFGVVLGLKQPWPVAMGLVFVEGLVITVLVLTRTREAVMNAIPLPLKHAIGVGIGLLIAFIGLQQAGLVVKSDATLVTYGPFTPAALVAVAGLLFTAWLLARRVRGAILVGMVAAALLAMAVGVARLPDRLLALPAPAQFATLGAALAPDTLAQVFRLGLATTLFAFLMTDFFDTMGSVVAVGAQGGFLDKQGRLPRLNRVLLADSLGAVLGGACGCSSVTTYIESATGVGAGGRTGLTAVVVAGLFLLAVFFWPLAGVVPACATAPALVIVGLLLIGGIRDIDWRDWPEALPAFLTVLTIPLTYSISRGIGAGLISYTLLQLACGRGKRLSPLLVGLSALFALDFALGL